MGPLAPHVRRARGQRGFTLLEMLVTLAVIGLAMGLVFGYGQTLLPQARLEASTSNLVNNLRSQRGHAQLTQQMVVFTYDLEEDVYSSHYPVEFDENGTEVGPGLTPILDPQSLEPEIIFEQVRLPDGSVRSEGQVAFEISPLGRMPPHDVLLVNREFPDIERAWVRVAGISNDARVLADLSEEPEVLNDASFR